MLTRTLGLLHKDCGGALPAVPLDELLDDLEAMGLEDGEEGGGGGDHEMGDA